MKKKILQKIKAMSIWSFRGLMLQFLFVGLAMAEPINAQQNKSVRDVVVRLNIDHSTILQTFADIESKTAFKFHYHKADIDNQVLLSIKNNKNSVADLLEIISEKAKLKFKQINNNIYVNKITNKLEQKLEVIIQTRTVTGKVTSMEDNEGLPGVNVVEKGTSNGTVTDVQGNYSLEVSEGATLVFNSVGYTTEEVEIGNRSTIDLVMNADVQQLQELVVVGYGVQEKANLTGAVSTVSSKEIMNQPVGQTTMALQGVAPGVTITQRSGQPGSDGGSIRIRGIGTLGDSNPLIMVDGVEADLNNIDPNEIESISILKDAASARNLWCKSC